MLASDGRVMTEDVALFVVGIGCDVLPGGVPGITPREIWNEIKRVKKDNDIRDDKYGKIYNHIMTFYLKIDKSKKMKEIDIRTFCQAFLYQPTLEFGKKDDSTAYKYVFHPPANLSPYLKSFLPPNANMDTDDNSDEERERDFEM